MLKILAIGNSFSQDATRYLKKMSQAARENIMVVNLYIGGCPLSRHYKNINNNDAAYSLEYGGESTGFCVSIKQALQSNEWDYVTMQQVSSSSFDYATYQPYLNALSDYVSFHAPHAKQVMHQTWAYEEGSKRLTEELGFSTSEEMFSSIRDAYAKAAEDICADGIIPAGESMFLAAKQGFSMHRDTFHASLGLGRYLLAATWFETLTGKSVIGNPLCELDVPAEKDDILKMQELAHSVAASYR